MSFKIKLYHDNNVIVKQEVDTFNEFDNLIVDLKKKYAHKEKRYRF